MLRVSTTVIVAALMAVSLAGAALANHPGHGGGQTTLSNLGCGLDEIARVKDADEWECNADLTLNEAAAADAQATADQAVSDAAEAQADADAAQGTADGAVGAAAAAQTDATDAQTTADQAVGAAAAAQTTATAAGNDAADAQADADAALSALAALEARILALEEGGGGGGEKLVFVTSGAYAPAAGDCSPADELAGFCVPSDGFFNSAADADALCQGAAMSAGLTIGGSPVFFAWLSTDVTKGASFETSPSIRFTRSASAYVDSLGTIIASNWADLIDDTLLTPIQYDEFGALRPDVGVWTGTHPDGSPTRCDCDSWSLNPISSATCVHTFPFVTPAATIGDSTANDFKWTEIEFSLCGAAHALYCFEQ